MLFPSNVIDYEYNCVIGDSIQKIKLSELKTKYTVLVFYPLDFTFVCPTEIKKFSQLYDEFVKLDTTVLLVSGDSVYSHLAWTKTPDCDGGIGNVKWPLVSDIVHNLSSQFNLFNEKTGTVMRSTVILNNKLEVLHLSANIDPIGRSSREVIRIIKALDHHASNGEVCYIDAEY